MKSIVYLLQEGLSKFSEIALFYLYFGAVHKEG